MIEKMMIVATCIPGVCVCVIECVRFIIHGKR